MNAACALQHFCDIHGPQTLLYTEEVANFYDVNDKDNDHVKAFYSQYIKSDKLTSKTGCQSCTMSSNTVLVSTVDSSSNTLYVSSASTPNQELFKNVRNACLRSLNIEKAMENSEPILFGDDEDGYCLSLSFSCKDFHARGSQRLYSLCYLCNDKHYLISLMRFISECMKEIVRWLQSDASDTYEQEGRIKINMKLGESATTYIFRPPPNMPTPRTFGDVLRDSNIIYRIHSLFVWILRTARSAVQESLFDALPTEEQAIKMEQYDVSEYEQRQAKIRSGTIVDIRSCTLTASNDLSCLQTSACASNGSYDRNATVFDEDNDDDYDSLDYQFSSYGYKALELFREFIQKLNNAEHLQYILSNWVTGNQLVIKYTNKFEDKVYIRALASVFRLFLPDGCCYLIESTDPVASCAANLVLWDLESTTSPKNSELAHDNSSITIKLILDNIDNHIRVARLEPQPTLKSNLIVPTYVKTIVELLTDSKLDDIAFEAIITQHKVKYLNKAKLYFQLGRCQIASALSLSERQQMEILNVINPNDLPVIRFWQKGLSQSYKARIRTLKQDDIQQQNTQKDGKMK